MELANTEQREQALAARRAAEVTSLLQVSGLVSSFSTSSRQRLAWLRTHAVGQQIAAVNAETRRARELRRDARIEEAVSARAARIVGQMTRAPRA